MRLLDVHGAPVNLIIRAAPDRAQDPGANKPKIPTVQLTAAVATNNVSNLRFGDSACARSAAKVERFF